MGKSGAQTFEQATKLPTLNFAKNSEINFTLAKEMNESSIVERFSEKLNVKVRFNRLKRRMRNRSSNIL